MRERPTRGEIEFDGSQSHLRRRVFYAVCAEVAHVLYSGSLSLIEKLRYNIGEVHTHHGGNQVHTRNPAQSSGKRRGLVPIKADVGSLASSRSDGDAETCQFSGNSRPRLAGGPEYKDAIVGSFIHRTAPGCFVGDATLSSADERLDS